MSGSPKPVLVTGAAGFIGSHVVEAFLVRGTPVVGVDNLDPFYSPQLKRRNIDESVALGSRTRKHGAPQSSAASSTVPAPVPAKSAPLYEFVEADVCEERSMRFLFDRVQPEGVIHLAAKAGVRPSIADPVGYTRANVLGTAVILREAERALCTRVVLASSSSVYGNSPRVPFSENDAALSPISPYAATKRSCELLAFTSFHLSGMPTACLRFFTVYGPRQRPDLAIGMFLGRVSRGEPIPVFGDGSTSRDYTFIDDIVAGVLAAYERIPAMGYRVWNLGNSTPVALSEMIATIAKVTGKTPAIERQPMQQGDVERTWADLTRSKAELGYEPGVTFEDGVRRQWEWMQKQ
jgi:UDP-glucuronate 4-epimerase